MRWRSIIGAQALVERVVPVFYREGLVWLHGGPAQLQGGAFARNMRGGRDMGGIFFVKESPDGWAHALGYAMLRHREGAVYRCRIDLAADDVFDFSQHFDREWFSKVIGPDAAKNLVDKVGDGPIPWLRTPEWQKSVETMLVRAGFKAMVVQERGGAVPVISLCVFDPSKIRILEVVPKAEAMEKYGRRPAA